MGLPAILLSVIIRHSSVETTMTRFAVALSVGAVAAVRVAMRLTDQRLGATRRGCHHAAPGRGEPQGRSVTANANGPSAPKARVLKRSPMRRWVAAFGWSWSGSGSSAKSASPYRSRPSR